MKAIRSESDKKQKPIVMSSGYASVNIKHSYHFNRNRRIMFNFLLNSRAIETARSREMLSKFFTASFLKSIFNLQLLSQSDTEQWKMVKCLQLSCRYERDWAHDYSTIAIGSLINGTYH